jgi:DNA-binding transcriptional LysR family regulator
MMDRLDAMSVLIAVVEAGSLSAAARRLGTPLATVSRKVSELEAQVGARLLTRTSRRALPTDAGRSYVEAARRILEDVAEAERAAAGEYRMPRGALVITAPIVFGRLHVLPVVMDFLRAYPEIAVRLVQADRVVDLAEGHIDLAVRIADLPDSSLIASRLGMIRRVVCGSPAYFAAHGVPQSPADLDRHDCIGVDGLWDPSAWALTGGGGEETAPARPRLIVNTAEAAVDAAVAGLGVTRVLSYQIADALRAGALQVVLRAYEPPPAPVSLVYLGRGALPLKLRAFLDFAAPRLRARLAEIAG